MKSLSTIDILAQLVAFPTVSRDPNLPLIDWVRNFLADHGVESHLVPDATKLKSNLFAIIGPREPGGLVLSGHTDVVPIDGQAWSSDPFVLTARGSRLYARGACDMKGFIAAALSRVPSWRSSQLSRPVSLMFSYDEEIGCLGAPSMISAAQEALPEPAAVFVGEPTSMRIANQHKGACLVRTRVSGIEAHSSLPHQGASAVMLAGELIAHLNGVSRRLASVSSEGTKRDDSDLLGRRELSRTDVCEPPYTTLSVNRIEGGTAANILAALCEFNWDIRTLPGGRAIAILDQLSDFADKLLGELARSGKHCSVETSVQADIPPLQADGGPAEQLARSATQSTTESIAVPFSTEGGQFQRAGWSTVICGPGSIEQAHKPDEFIERSELQTCEAFLDRAVRQQCE